MRKLQLLCVLLLSVGYLSAQPKYKAYDDTTAFLNGSGVVLTEVQPYQVENLALLGKVWGFLKYYHPYIASGNVNWDYALFRLLPSYLAVTNKDQRNTLLLQWINQLGKPAVCKDCSDAILSKATLLPDLEWINDKQQLNDSLVAVLQYIKQNRHQGRQFYMDLHPGVENPNITNEAAYRQFVYPDAGYRLLTLFRYWNIIQYWFPNRHLIDEDWKETLTLFIPKMIAASNTTEYLVVTQQLIGRVQDTHANIWSRHQELEDWRGNYFAPVTIQFINDMPVVRGIILSEKAQQSNLRPGDIIQTINGKKVSDVIKERLPNLPASNYSTQLRDLAAQLLRSKEPQTTITLLRDKELIQTTIINTIPESRADWFPYDYPYHKDSSFFFIEPGIGYINLGKIKKTQVDSVFKALKGSKGLVIDNRQYPSDFPIYFIAARLLPARVPFTVIPVGQLDYPGAFVTKKPLYAGVKKNKDYYKGKVVILIDQGTQSSGEFHTMAFELAPQATVIGSTTAGADGNVSGLLLPGGIRTMFSGIGILYPDGRETQRIGIVPDVEVKQTVEGIKAGRDELMEKAIEIITGEKKIIQPAKPVL
jgi:C-terminal processing protease CtpA/Prc